MPHRLALPLLATFTACLGEWGPLPCDTPTEPVIEARSAGCITVAEDSILLVRTSHGWGVPGGYVRQGETTAQTAMRETLEESAVPTEPGGVFCRAKNGFVAHTCTTEGKPHTHGDGNETINARWFTSEGIEGLPDRELRYPAQREAYLRALE